MAKHERDRERDTSKRPPREPQKRTAGRDSFPATPASEKTGAGGGARVPNRTWMATHGRDLRFFLLFVLFLGTLWVSTHIPYMQNQVFPEYLRLNSIGAASLLNVFGEGVISRGNVLSSPRFQVSIERGCDAIAPSLVFCAAVLASPVSWSARAAAVLVGTTLLMLINFIRVVSLYYTGAYFRPAFDIMHLDVWQALFVFFAVVLWLFWASWATRRRSAPQHATA